MTQQQTDIDYDRIERAINYIAEHLRDNPWLEQIVAAVLVSSYHFKWMSSKWAGVSPEKFAQFLSLTHAKTQLQQGGQRAGRCPCGWLVGWRPVA